MNRSAIFSVALRVTEAALFLGALAAFFMGYIPFEVTFILCAIAIALSWFEHVFLRRTR